MWWLLPLAQAAAGRPAGLTPDALDDPAPWEGRARLLLDGPDACVQLQGHVVFTVALFTPGGWLSPGDRHDLVAKGSFDGTLDHGIWTRLDMHWGADDPTFTDDQDTSGALALDRPHPIVGRLPAATPDPTGDADASGKTQISISASGKTTTQVLVGGSEEALGLLDQLVANIDPAVTTAFATWEDDQRAVVLHQFSPLGGGQGSLELTAIFPEGGPPTSVDAVLPKQVRATDGMITISLHDAQLHVRSQQTALGTLPGEEVASMVVTVLGYTLGVNQRITYLQARTCP